MIDKRVKSLAEAVSGIADGATILCAGFGGAGLPDALCEAVVEQGARDLTVVANNAGTGRRGLAALLAAGRVRRIICSFPRSSGSIVFEELYAAGRIELELVPQGIISERMRCAAAGLAVSTRRFRSGPGSPTARSTTRSTAACMFWKNR